MNTHTRMLTGIGGLLLAAGCATELLADEVPAGTALLDPSAPGTNLNWITLGVGHTFLTGDQGAFQQRQQLPEGLMGGIEDLHFEAKAGSKGLLEIDAHSLLGLNDHLLRIGLSQEDLGFVRGGYREFTTFYDGSGGWFPPNGAWFNLYDDALELDRRELFVEAGLRLPDVPQITLRYSHFEREGEKGSTSWGDTGLTGVAPPNNIRALVPTLWNLDEDRDLFEAEARHNVGKTTFGVGLRYEAAQHDNRRYETRRPTEPQERVVTHNEAYDSDLFNVHAFSETRAMEAVTFTLGYSFTRLDTDLFGSRVYGATYDAVYDPLFARRQFHDEGFLDLTGGTQLKQHVASMNLLWVPVPNLFVVPNVRIEAQNQDGLASFTETDVGAPPGLVSMQAPIENTRERRVIDVMPGVEARYTGLTNWVLYGQANWSFGEGDLQEREIETDEAGDVTLIRRDTDSERRVQKYAVGATWYPLRRLNFATQYYYKVRDNNYDHPVDTTTNLPPSADRYPAFLRDQDFATHDVNFRVTWRPLTTLTFISRYDLQLSTVDTRADFLSEVESGRLRTHIFGQTVNWVPWSRLYLQAQVNLVDDTLQTPANHLGGAADNLVPKSHNDYLTTSFMVGFALDQRTDLQAQYFYYRADNFINNSAVSMPFGADAEEHGVTATLTRLLNPNVRWNLRYGWFDNRDVTFGGHNSYTAHLVYSSLQFFF